MANEEHLKILERGVTVWNQWRTEHPDTTPNLTGLELRGANLERIDLSNAGVNNAVLESANLRHADLRKASLEVTNFNRADLSGAVLSDAELFAADLNETLLINADLRWTNFLSANMVRAIMVGAFCELTNFSHVDLRWADVEGATFNSTIFGDTNLAQVKGLESCNHIGPSIVDHQTLVKSGRLPLNFLRGCGLPDTLIEYLPSLISDPIQFNSCFISYSSKDNMFAERLHADLQDKGVRCWFAPENLKIGDKIRSRIDEVIHIHDKVLVILSKNSIKSDWVEKEVETALEKERQQKRMVLFPIRLDERVMKINAGWAADIRRLRHIADFRHWKNPVEYENAFSRLLHDLRAKE